MPSFSKAYARFMKFVFSFEALEKLFTRLSAPVQNMALYDITNLFATNLPKFLKLRKPALYIFFPAN